MPRDPFEREKPFVERLMQWIKLQVVEYRNPNAEAGHQTGADVLVVLANGCRIGVQVTMIDTGEEPGKSIAAEKQLARHAERQGHGVYATWAQGNMRKVVAAIARSVSRKAQISLRHDQKGFHQLWLLMCSGAPETGLLASTLVMTPWLSADDLNAATLALLEDSQYPHVSDWPTRSVTTSHRHGSYQGNKLPVS